MTLRYTFDTNSLSALIREPDGVVGARVDAVGVDAVCCSVVVAAELRFGVAKRRSSTLRTRVEGVLSRLRVLPLAEPADAIYGEIRAELERRGRPIGPNDLLIAAHALASGLVLVTANVREFERVEGLRIEDWSSPAG